MAATQNLHLVFCLLVATHKPLQQGHKHIYKFHMKIVSYANHYKCSDDTIAEVC